MAFSRGREDLSFRGSFYFERGNGSALGNAVVMSRRGYSFLRGFLVNARHFVSRLIVFLRTWKKRFGQAGFCSSYSNSNQDYFGDFSNWETASRNSQGYDSASIFEKVTRSAHAIREGKAAYERDSVLFSRIEYSWPLLAGLLLASVQDRGTLNVIDFGGSFGSTFFQNRVFLQSLRVSWSIVEQPRFVQYGRAHFQDDEIRFFSTISEALNSVIPNCVIFSGVLQYLPDPFQVLDQVINSDIPFLLIDRNAFHLGSGDRYMIQRASPEVFLATYPIVFFDIMKFKEYLEPHFLLIEEFPALDQGPGDTLVFRGMIWKRK